MNHTDELPEPSLPAHLNVAVRGLPKDVGEKVGYAIIEILRHYSRVLPLDGLDGVTVGLDYHEALASIDRGFADFKNVPTPTQDEALAVGIAMALPVNREGIVKTHLVFGEMLIAHLLAEETESEILAALQLISHELGHVVEHDLKFKAFGNWAFENLASLVPCPLDQYLWGISHHMWDEYCANRIAASVTARGAMECDLLREIAKAYQKRISVGRWRYHSRLSSLDEFLEVVAHNLRLALLATGYVLGLKDAALEGATVSNSDLSVLDEPEVIPFLRFHDSLRKLWDTRRNWEAYSDFLTLNPPTLELLHDLELYPRLLDSGEVYMDIPLRFQ